MAHLMRQHFFKLGDDIWTAPTHNRNLRTIDADCSMLTRVIHLENAGDCTGSAVYHLPCLAACWRRHHLAHKRLFSIRQPGATLTVAGLNLGEQYPQAS